MSSLCVRPAKTDDLSAIYAIYADARDYMRKAENETQWGNSYPPKDLILSDLESGCLYVCTDGSAVAAVFYFHIGEDPTYRVIEDGAWQSSGHFPTSYGVIHRIAVAASYRGKGTVSVCFDYGYRLCCHKGLDLRIDTHKDNIPMQRALAKNGFRYCGIIYTSEGSARMAYQKLPHADTSERAGLPT